jgi:hypothetical protein
MECQNYDKVDEFYQYQDYLDKSYFNKLTQYLKTTSQIREKLSNEAWINDFCTGVVSKTYQFSNEKYDDLSDKGLSKFFTRTQDLGVWMGKYTEVPKYNEVREKWSVSKFYTTAKDDPVFGYIKFSEKCNYKPNLVNSLGIFEHPLVYQIYKGLVHMSAYVHCKTCDDGRAVQLIQLLETKLDALNQKMEENPAYFGHVSEQKLTKLVINFFNGWFAATKLASIILPLKEIKANPENLEKHLEEIRDIITVHCERIINSIELPSSEELKIIEENKFDSESNLIDIDECYNKKFFHFHTGRKFMNFLTNYVLGYYFITFRSLSQIVASLGPKKKKPNYNDTSLGKIISTPLKDLFKHIKDQLLTNSCKFEVSYTSNFFEI